jgi:hypothetical protein
VVQGTTADSHNLPTWISLSLRISLLLPGKVIRSGTQEVPVSAGGRGKETHDGERTLSQDGEHVLWTHTGECQNTRAASVTLIEYLSLF